LDIPHPNATHSPYTQINAATLTPTAMAHIITAVAGAAA
jgi:hypothetical protein